LKQELEEIKKTLQKFKQDQLLKKQLQKEKEINKWLKWEKDKMFG